MSAWLFGNSVSEFIDALERDSKLSFSLNDKVLEQSINLKSSSKAQRRTAETVVKLQECKPSSEFTQSLKTRVQTQPQPEVLPLNETLNIERQEILNCEEIFVGCCWRISRRFY